MNKKVCYNKNIKDDDIFKLGLQDYHLINCEAGLNITKDELEKNGKIKVIATSCRDILEEYMSSNQHLDTMSNTRLIIK